MLRGQLLHPEILESLGAAGHSSRVLIADGNFPFRTRCGANSKLVQLNLSAGVVTVTQVLEALLSAIPVEGATVMAYPTEGPYSLTEDPAIWSEFERLLERETRPSVALDRLERFKFYDESASSDVVLTVATADQRIFANLLLTIGVVR